MQDLSPSATTASLGTTSGSPVGLPSTGWVRGDPTFEAVAQSTWLRGSGPEKGPLPPEGGGKDTFSEAQTSRPAHGEDRGECT